MSFIIAHTTTENKKDAGTMAEKIIKLNLGYCAQPSKIKSFYRWKGEIEKSEEFKLNIKTTSKKYKKPEKFAILNHKYKLPEIIAIKINRGYKRYLN